MAENYKLIESSNLPDLKDILTPRFHIPAVLATTLPEITTIMTSGNNTLTVPENSQIVVPVLPECISLIAKVPEVVYTEPQYLGDRKEVMISQVLPGYAPSYASDYMPQQVNSHSFNTFVNTMSINVSRYPALSEVTDSKTYTPQEKKRKEDFKDESSITSRRQYEYVPAEYFSGEGMSKVQTAGVVQSQSVCIVKPEVLSSGRLLTNMTTIPIQLIEGQNPEFPNSVNTIETKSPSYTPTQNGAMKDAVDGAVGAVSS